jgi:hypothetical protein
MPWITKTVLGLLCAAGLFAAPKARADIPPPDACQTQGAACHNGGEDYDKDGLCAKATCTKGAPGQQMTYECFKCEAGTVRGDAGATAVNETVDPKDEGGCSVRALGTEKGIATLMLGLGLGALALSRRRR